METLPPVLLCPSSASLNEGQLSIFITNLGKYNEGELVGEWVNLPTNIEFMSACLKRIGIDGINYEEYFITDYDLTIDRLSRYLPEYADLNELNMLAAKLEMLDADDITKYEAIIESGEYTQSLKDLINLTDNLDSFNLLADVYDESDLGYYWIEESGCYDLSTLGNLANYFDYEKFGRDIAINEGGTFVAQGYLYDLGESFNDDYNGQSIPEEYQVLS